jgi:alpha-N-arabinofuranosidase
VNIDPLKTIAVRTSFEGSSWKNVTGNILTSDKFNDVNTFENPDKIKVATFSGAKKDKDELVVSLPPKSVVVLELK